MTVLLVSRLRSPAPMVAVGIGVLVGAALRNAPIAIVDLASSSIGEPVANCGVEAAAECAVRNTPRAIVEVARFGLAVLAVAAFLAFLGAIGTAWGCHRLHTMDPTRPDDVVDAAARADQVGLGLIACGIALLMPALWLSLSFVTSLAT